MLNAASSQAQIADSEHLRLLSIFHYVVSGLAALFACIPIIHLVLGLVMIIAPEKMGPPNNQPPVFIGVFLVALAVGLIVCGWVFAALLLYAGRCIARRRHYTFCFVMACVACMFMPFGTVLGVFTILILMRPTVKELFVPKPSF